MTKANTLLRLVMLFVFSMVSESALAQYVEDSDTAAVVQDQGMAEVVLTAGKRYRGRLLENKFNNVDGYVILEFEDASTLRIPSNMIKRLRMLDRSELRLGAYEYRNPVPEHYILSTSAFMPKEGTGYGQLTGFLLPHIHYGITDWFSLSAGVELFTTTLSVLTYGMIYPFVYVRPKVGVEVADDLRASFGAMLGTLPFSSGENPFFTNLSAALTYGNEDNNITLNVTELSTEELDVKSRSAGLLGTARVSKRFSLLGEFWVLDLNQPAYSNNIIGVGVRFFGERFKFDLALYTMPELINAFNSGTSGFILPGLPIITLSFVF